MQSSINITFGGEQLLLRADRTLYWPARQSLLFADLHAGKAAHLRRYGSAVPGGSLEADLARLAQAAHDTAARTIICLGDLFHSDINQEWQILAGWVRRQPFAVQLVRGNHDRFISDALLQAAGIGVWPEPHAMPPFDFRHHPSESSASGSAIIAAHLHPVARLRGAGRETMRLPCFWQQPHQLVLPAFGSLTGGYEISTQAGDTIYACGSDRQTILPIPVQA